MVKWDNNDCEDNREVITILVQDADDGNDSDDGDNDNECDHDNNNDNDDDDNDDDGREIGDNNSKCCGSVDDNKAKKKIVMLPSPDQNLKIGSVGRFFFFFSVP